MKTLEITLSENKLNEFAPSSMGDNDGNDGFSDDTLKRLAAQWWHGDEDPRVEQTLMASGWEIGQDEGYDDEPGVFVVQAGDINGNSYMSWSAEELKGLSEELTMKHQRNHTTQKYADRSNSLAQRSYSMAEVPNVTKSADGHPTVKYRTDRTGKAGATRVDPTITPTTVKRKDSDKPMPSFLKKQQGVGESYNPEYDDEAGMAQSNLRTMARAVTGLIKTIENNDNLPEWAQEKLAKAESMLVSVWDYLQSQKELGTNPKQKMTEGSLDEINDIVSRMMDKYITKYCSGLLDSDHLISIISKAAKVVSNKYKMNQRDAEKLIGDYVEDKVKQSKSQPDPVSESEIKEEQLLATKLKKQLELFKRGADKELGKKPKDSAIQQKKQEK